jgi:pyruvate formate-lyase/glycerol dehydratase family glycyl radical enzyme
MKKGMQMNACATDGLSERIARIRASIIARKGSFLKDDNPLSGAVALWRAFDGEKSVVQVRAAYLRELVLLARIEIEPDWTLAGCHLPTAQFGIAPPDPAKPEHAGLMKELGVPSEALQQVRDTVLQWGKGSDYAAGRALPENSRGVGQWNSDPITQSVFWAWGWIENHSIRDFAKVLKIGFLGIREEVEQCVREARVSDADFVQKDNFWQAALAVCDAGILLGRRYAETAAALAESSASAQERDRLLAMAERCARVPQHGARTFLEAVQSLWFSYILTCGEDGINANSIGRMDQFLYPYYKADIKAGRLAREAAVEIMEELACRLHLEYNVTAITLGGVDRKGRDAVNDLSYVILEATRRADLIRDLSVRLHRNSPEPFVRTVAGMIARGGGIPFIFNDECFIKALNNRGIPLKDARDYAPIGCIELTIPGRANPHAVSGWFNALKCVELAIFNGQDPASGEQVGPKTGELAGFATFEDWFDAYRKQVEYFADRMVYLCNRGELRQRERGPLPCWSVLTDDCIKRGRDITDGGPVYNYHSICFLGTADAADSMMALKKLVFEEKRVAPARLIEALRANFEGCEPLRQMLMHEAPKYGNDDAAVDELARCVDDHFIAVMDRMRSPLNGRYFTHLFSFVCNIPFGKTVGATPDGRRSREPLAYSLSAHQGRDVRGVTALLNSLARLPHDKAAGATAAIIEVDPALVQGAAGVERLKQLIQTAVAMKIGQLQWNVTTVERLRQAQEDPERYGNIAVRVAGYSQMFKLVDRELQDHIIARTKHRN